MGRRLIEVDLDAQEGFTLRVRPFGLLPESARGHLVAARKELLLALRSMVDEAVTRLEEKEPVPRRARKVRVEKERTSTAE